MYIIMLFIHVLSYILFTADCYYVEINYHNICIFGHVLLALLL